MAFQIDTGATCNIIRFNDIPPAVKIDTSERISLRFYNDSTETSVGTCVLRLSHAGQTHTVKFHVVTNGAASLIGAQSSLEMGLISVDTETVYRSQAELPMLSACTEKDFLTLYPEVFKPVVGCFPGCLSLNLATAAKPTHMATRRIPMAL